MRSTRHVLVMLLPLLLIALAACGREAVTPVGAVGGASVPDYRKLLPAFPLPHELRVPGKADAAGDYRAAHPGWYETTVPPVGAFRALREWEPMSSLLLAYTTSLVGDVAVGQTVVDTIQAAYPHGTVIVLHDTAAARADVTARLVAAGVPADQIGDGRAVRFELIPLDAFWTIDFGPLPLVNDLGTVAFLDWQYYWSRYLDDAVPSELGERWGASVYRMPVNYEGGNFQADGMGTCYTSERGLQNAGVAEADLRTHYKQYAGCDRLVVLKDLATDGTGHIDMFFKLVTPARAVLGAFTDAQDPQARADMNDNDTLLKGLALPAGTAMTVLRMPHPNAYSGAWGTIPRTYLNSTLFNGTNLWPVYTADQDLQADAAAVWSLAMPSWNHVGILSDEISTLSGAVHCITRTLPDLPLARWIANGSCDATSGSCVAPEGGYTGACASDTSCVGPQWLCVLAGTCGAVVDTCDGVTYEGCCDGATVRWCENGALQSVDCATAQPSTPKCGWVASAGYYWCDTTGAADPTGAFPWACSGACVPDCAGKACDADDGCGRACGCANGFLCEAGACVACVPACAGKACGPDGCGGSCGACGLDEACESGQCVNLCGGLSYEGCCDGAKVSWCDANGTQTVDCATLQSAAGPKCGWNAEQGYYWCGVDNGTDPSGAFPWACPGGCVPDCAGRACDADDGCGQACGCAAGFLCEAGACVACVPACAGKACGPDGCGGSCGACATGFSCVDGACLDACAGLTYEGCCEGAVVRWCENGALQQVDCATSSTVPGPLCGWEATNGFYWCDTVGDPDPSGVFPQDCSGGCVPACGGKVCGPDGCGGSCGECADGQACVAGQCDTCDGLTYEGCCEHDTVRWCENGQRYEVSCATSSAGPLCTWLASAGYYWCGSAAVADPSGAFAPACPGCVPECAGKACGADGCFGTCGACGDGQICRDGACEACTPACVGKVCGDDGCLGSCGECGAGLACQAGQCVDPCGGITFEGCCDGSVVTWCSGGVVSERDCATTVNPVGSKCGWSDSLGYFWCVDTNAPHPDGLFPWACPGGCVPTCGGKACDADDGCGQPCGCPAGAVCEGGACVACTPDCVGKACGDDGCGGACGACGPDEQCTGGQCVNRCDGLTYEGCCNGPVVRWCDVNGVQEFDCATSGGAEGALCGWNAGSAFYWCAPSEEVEPTGAFPRECPVPCVPDCDGSSCGPDGCGGSCGTCPDHHACDAGACVYVPWCGDDTCDPGESCASCPADCGCACGEGCLVGVCVRTACEGKVCGPDGCGGSCGNCASGSSCQDGLCVADAACGDGACNGLEACDTCWADCACDCGEVCSLGVCVYRACDDRECGSDGCGGSCGTCGAHHVCEMGQCLYVAWCGDGACDAAEDCADCPADCACDCGEACVAGACTFEACDGKACGSDGCGGSCGACADHYACEQGACVYVPWCGDAVCNGAETCSTCAADCGCGCGRVCDHDACVFTACDGLACGPDGCGGSCGTCPDHHTCQKGACAYVPWCGDGACDAGEDCGACPTDCACGCGQICQGSACAFTACDGKVCGDDGCGGSCGKCAEHFECRKGACDYVPWCGDGTCDPAEDCAACAADCGCACGQACVAGACTFTACDGKECGPDGCGGSCGACADHHACHEGVCDYVPWCGDGTCDAGETCATCAADCGCACGEACVGGGCAFTACDGKACGSDGCDGSCGSCAEHHACEAGVCVYEPWCGDGACDAGETCASCAADCACGCGRACEGGSCVYTACDDLACGDDGCGGSCGACSEHHECLAGACVYVPWCGDAACDAGETCATCAADCACGCGQACEGGACVFTACSGKACGDDGCGGTCGTCGEHEACLEGACVVQPYCGDGVCNGDEACDTCEADCDCPCGEACTAGECVYVGCAGRECGDDGCDPAGSCGACAEHEACVDGACVEAPWCGDGTCDLDEGCAACPADCGCGCGQACVEAACVFTACADRECGDDGCGGSCGACGCGEACVEGACTVQACDGRECGDDGCGGSCGACSEHQACDDGACVDQPWCGDGSCGLDETCASCPADCGCDDAHVCVEGACEPRPCEPACSGRECGDDGCGTSCGECPKGDACNAEGACVTGQPDGDEPDAVGPDAPTLDVGADDGVGPDDEPEEQGEGGSCAFASGPGGHAAWSLLLTLALLGLAWARRRSA